MAIALTWALLEYAQLVLLLITDQEAVRICYQQNYSVAQMKDQAERARVKEKHRSHHDRQTIPELRTESKERVKSDQISTHIPVTPSQLSDDSDTEETKSKCHGPAHMESSLPDKPICGCEEEDYLVAMEDDVRRPCHTEPMNPATKRPAPILTHSEEKHESDHGQGSPLKQASVAEPKKTGASSATRNTAHEKEEAEHHFKDDLLPAADETLMDAL
ncbi:uncharacterized protein UTRI_05056_B [Ustilago trichophora]|uniref:Uncharacterized protein n=1 Tax=Ustilago trichophora TaxID=86804 RepID=A0A5C3EF81_9BASI|nr:uncharacterized protein UTRI_05056_B [Ustilago trichophora]